MVRNERNNETQAWKRKFKLRRKKQIENRAKNKGSFSDEIEVEITKKTNNNVLEKCS